MFTAALFTIAKICKQPKGPSADEWIKKKCCICTIEYDSVIKNKKEWNLANCNNMDGARGCCAEWNKSDEDKYHMISLRCRIKKKQNKWICRTETDLCEEVVGLGEKGEEIKKYKLIVTE